MPSGKGACGGFSLWQHHESASQDLSVPDRAVRSSHRRDEARAGGTIHDPLLVVNRSGSRLFEGAVAGQCQRSASGATPLVAGVFIQRGPSRISPSTLTSWE